MKRLLTAFIIILAAATAALAQTHTGTITGIVFDEQGEPLPGVEVAISSPQLMTPQIVQVTNQKGFFRFSYVPPGSYMIKAALQGFSPAVKENVVVSLGLVTDQNLEMSSEKLDNQVVVVGLAPSVALENTKMSMNVGSKELMRLPVTRSLGSYMALAPGVLNGGIALGGGTRENAMNVDGIQMTDPGAGAGQTTIQGMDSYDEVQVETAGHAAEYGNVSGAVINVITKAGGNTFDGQLTYYHQNKGLLSKNYEGTGLSAPSSKQIFNHDVNASLGGPIVKDKIWFFLSGGAIWNKKNVYGFAADMPKTTLSGVGKLTFQPNARNNISVMLNVHNMDQPYYNGSQYTALEAGCDIVSEGTSGILNWMSTLGSNTFLETRLTLAQQRNDYTDRVEEVSMYDYATNMSYNGGGGDFYQRRTRWTGQASLTHYLDDLLGSHQFKAGVEYEKGESKNRSDSVVDEYGMSTYYTMEGAPYVAVRLLPADQPWQIDSFKQIAGYIQDSWRPNKYLVANLGLRYDYATSYTPAQGDYDKITLSKWNTLEPRLTLGIDPFGRGKTGIKLGFSRYALLMYTWTYDLNPNVQAYEAYFNPSPGEFYLVEWYVPLSYTVDPDLKRPYTNEYLVSLDQVLASDWSVKASYIHRATRDFVTTEDSARTSEWYEPVTVDNPYTEGTMTIYNLIEGAPNPYYYVSNNPLAKKDYDAFIFEINKHLSHRYQFRLNYTWSRAKGTETQGSSSSGGGLNSIYSDWNDPNFLINKSGILDRDRTHEIKFQGFYMAPLGFVLGLSYQGVSGLSYTPYRTYTLDQGAESVLLVSQGSLRMPFMNKIDIRVEKEFGFKGSTLAVFGTVYNLLNSNTTTGINTNFTSSRYGLTTGIMTARTVELGARYTF
ncbi:MAG TPA: TonB-dependent receptor [Candidatus Aminicenantes bacterium]|nr:TonB-dependent receptor [Candidatus Aminicenantes bacterium]HRY65850.1 TonB-dependent receptor [Candidatus Aminicenantes bacterium]HRZ72824.1 TonB-dependent receptor [Candidatus Aminicenantes bacterium]